MNEHLSAGFIYDFEVARARLTQSQLAVMPAFKSISNQYLLSFYNLRTMFKEV